MGMLRRYHEERDHRSGGHGRGGRGGGRGGRGAGAGGHGGSNGRGSAVVHTPREFGDRRSRDREFLERDRDIADRERDFRDRERVRRSAPPLPALRAVLWLCMSGAAWCKPNLDAPLRAAFQRACGTCNQNCTV